MANVTKKTSADYLADYEAAVAKANKIIKAEKFDHEAYEATINDLKVAEGAYASAYEKELYAEYGNKANPREEILRLYRYEVVAHKEVRDKKQNNKLVLVEKTKKLKSIDYLEFCKYLDLPTEWNDALSKFNYLMTLKKAGGVGNDGKAIKASYKMTDDARKMQLGVTLTSNRQMCKALQACLDLMFDNTKEGGLPKYRVTNHDVGFLDDVYTKIDNRNARPGIVVSKDKTLRAALVAIASHLIVGDSYNVHGFAGEQKADKKPAPTVADTNKSSELVTVVAAEQPAATAKKNKAVKKSKAAA